MGRGEAIILNKCVDVFVNILFMVNLSNVFSADKVILNQVVRDQRDTTYRVELQHLSLLSCRVELDMKALDIFIDMGFPHRVIILVFISGLPGIY